MNNPKPQYHHGDLHGALLQTASKLIREEGIDRLSIRKLADAVGVSRSAPYHHFRDKRELLCAIAEEGFRQQDQRLDALPDCDIRPRFEQLVLEYIRFAIEHQEQYDLMYGREIWKAGVPSASLEQAANASFKRWLEEIGRVQAAGGMTSEVSTLRLAQVSWATMHGLCRLLIDGIYVDSADIEEMGRTAVRLLLQSAA